MADIGSQSAVTTNHSDGERRRALSIFRYLHDLALLKTAVVRDLGSYERVFWLDAVRKKPGCTAQCFRPDSTDGWLGDELIEDDVWLKIRKWVEPVIPPAPGALEPWIVSHRGTDGESPPQLMDRIQRPFDGRKSQDSDTGQAAIEWELLENHPEIKAAHRDYIDRHWKPWAEMHRAWRDFQENIYSPLYGIHRDLKRLGEEFELVLGLGCLTWITPNKQHVRRHLIASQVALEFDPAGGLFTLRPGSDGAKLVLEVDMLDAGQQPTAIQMDAVKSDLAAAGDNPWEFDVLDRALRGFAQAIDKDGAYYGSEYASRPTEQVAKVTFAPALLLRRRNSRGLLIALKAIIEQLQNGVAIPIGVSKLTGIAAGARIGEAPEPLLNSVPVTPTGPIYFPLAANEDQRQIVELLNDRHGVLVQGPPGTGKSHTIANLICHLLATGKRVLITAQTPRALQVLREKLPPEIQPLCLSVLGNDKTAQDNVEDSVRRITDNADLWNSDATAAEIRNADKQLKQLFERETSLDRDLRIFREAEVHEHTVADGAYKGSAQAIADQVRREQTQFKWFTDRNEIGQQPGISPDDLRAYREGRIRIPAARAAELEMQRPGRGTEILPQLIREFRELRERVRAIADIESPLTKSPLEDVKAAYSSIRALQESIQKLQVSTTPWAALALGHVLLGMTQTWKLLASQTGEAIAGISKKVANVDGTGIHLPTSRRHDILLADASDLITHLRNGGRLGFWIFRPKVARRTKYICHEATVGGRRCDTVETLTAVKEHLECSMALARTWALWDGKCSPTTKTMSQQVAELQEIGVLLAQILAVGPLAEAASSALARLRLPSVPPLHDSRAVEAFAVLCAERIARGEFERVKLQLAARVQILRKLETAPNAHPVCARLADSAERRDERGLTAALDELSALDTDATSFDTWANLEKRLRDVAPKLAQSIRETATDATWLERFETWTAAWRHAQADAWLRKYTDTRKAVVVEAELKQVKERIGSLLEHASATRAWSSCLSAMSPAHQQHLKAWRQAIKKLGKGTGRHASHWRRVAQGELEQCRDAIPAWVMPLYRVFESVKPAPGIFDVAIVDESSQCGPESLILFYLVKKVIVVGDDMQISPSNVGIDKDQAKTLLREHLDGIELANTFDVDSSLFDHGQIRLGKRVTLREHFRCMPEVIRFSNDLCYKGSLIPLRQYPPKRLAPFVARFIPGGRREGGPQSARNEAEAQAIAETIAACCRDPMYEDRTIGVISLLGEHQAKRIEQLLLERIGAEEIERRRIVCGDAYSFQGDERHVIFLSLVVATREDGERGFNALTKLSDMQRFNVAASRAQDQFWLFHSVMPEDIGNRECMRHKLLTYFYDRARHAARSVGIDLAALRSAAETPERPETPPQPFDSWFEVDVYLRLLARGYRVLPQYKAGRHSIDLVVEGNTRLAVECDGDRWHGPERFDEDMARQRQLERANWRFWRVRGSIFYRDPDAALIPLWKLLAEYEIEPMPALDGSGSSEGYVPTVPEPAPAEVNSA